VISLFVQGSRRVAICSILSLTISACGGDGTAINGIGNSNPPPAGDTPPAAVPPAIDTIPPAAVTDIEASTLSDNAVQLTWTTSGDDGNQGTASQYDLRYSTNVINIGNWGSASRVNNEPLPGVAGSQESLTVPGLNADTQYYFALKVMDEAGNESTLSNVDSAITDANQGGAGTVAGAVSTPYPTVEHISIEWEIDGDNDEDGVVSVNYREVGTNNWQQGMNLIRVPAGSTSPFDFSWSNKHSGSLFNLQPDTEYEIELTLDDPDSGQVVRVVTARSRPVPVAPVNANIISANPATLLSLLDSASAGEVLLLAPGTYSGFSVNRNGVAGQPIVIRGEDPDTVIINGNVNLTGRQHVYLERVTVNGTVTLNNGEYLVVRESNVNTSGSGIVAQANGVENAYIVDNRVIGSTAWNSSTVGAQGANSGEGIQLTGPGNVIAYNYVKGFRDAISTLEGNSAVNQISIDIYNNDIEVGADDAIEADYTRGNVRVLNNRISNSFVGLSSQPTLGGPIYYIRNVMYNIINTPFKLHNGSVGDIAYHNTVVKSGDAFAVYTTTTWSRARFRNNLFIGGEGGGVYGGYSNGDGAVANLGAAAANSNLDYDAFGSIGTNRFDGRIGNTVFNGLADMRALTTEAHAQEVDMSIFADTVPFPSNPFPEKPIPDLRLQQGNNAVDFGVLIPGLNDDFQGNAPDIGAYELGGNLPHYGPRN
jgi:hypothetical protein